MALAFPLTVPQFFSGLRIGPISLDLPAASQISRTAGGDVIAASVGARLWRADLALVPAYNQDIAAIRARIHLLRQPGASLLVRAVPGSMPRRDPYGSILGGATPTLASLSSDNRVIGIAGLPPGYEISDGDYLSAQYGSGPVRYAFHQVVAGGVAGPDGVASGIELTPYVRPGLAVGAAITLLNPVFKAVLVDSSTGSALPSMTTGITLSFQQTLR